MLKHDSKHKRLGWFLFIVYLLLVIYLMFFQRSWDGRPTRATPTIWSYLRRSNDSTRTAISWVWRHFS